MMKTQTHTGRAMRTGGAVAAAALLLGACAFNDPALKEVQGASSTGSAFDQALTEEYKGLSAFEAEEMYDWRDAVTFANKGLAAAGGNSPDPEVAANWNLTPGNASAVSEVREQLVSLLNAGAREQKPEAAARAQARFDCWVEQLEEDFQDKHIATCREDMLMAISELQEIPVAVVEQEPAPEPEQAPLGEGLGPVRYIIFFDFDSAVVDSDGQAVVDQLSNDFPSFTNPQIQMVGFTDTSGSNDYNLRLSQRRVNNALSAVTAKGLPSGIISTGYQGESNPRIDTGDGVRERGNRRVEIQVFQ